VIATVITIIFLGIAYIYQQNMFSRNLQQLSRNSFSSIAIRGYKKTIEQLAKEKPDILKNANVFVRVDFNTPMDKKDPTKIKDDTRIKEALPTISFLSKNGAKVILASHLGRPKGIDETLRMEPQAKRLSDLLSKFNDASSPNKSSNSSVSVSKPNVSYVKDCIGDNVSEKLKSLKAGDILMLENVRFYKEEEKNDIKFAEKLSKDIDIYVNDAFGTAHRAHASTAGIAKFTKHNVAGYLMEKEIKFLKSAIDEPKRPFAAIVGGSKVSTKINVIKSLINKCDKIFLGGAMIFTFYKAKGFGIGKSMIEDDFVNTAKEILLMAEQKGVKLYFPSDIVCTKKFPEDPKKKELLESQIVSVNAIPSDSMGLDIGPETIKSFHENLLDCKTIVWNGPMGVFEFDQFAKGTNAIAQTLAEVTQKGGITIVGGGDSVSAVQNAGLTSKMSHISTGGGASLEMLEGLELPGVACLDNA
jgi:phosphoglycerate kinase